MYYLVDKIYIYIRMCALREHLSSNFSSALLVLCLFILVSNDRASSAGNFFDVVCESESPREFY